MGCRVSYLLTLTTLSSGICPYEKICISRIGRIVFGRVRRGEKKAEQPQAGSAPAANAEAAATDTLNIYNWSNYVDESTVEDFKKSQQFEADLRFV